METVQSLQKAGITVSFELLESILLEDQDDHVRHSLDLIRDSGIELEVDDFGSGHASILGLLEVKPNTLKIDKRLTQTVEDDAASRDLIRSVVGIARALGIRTTAEGVETAKQMRLMHLLGCDSIQGYNLSKPLDAQGIFDWTTSYGEQPSRRSAKEAWPAARSAATGSL